MISISKLRFGKRRLSVWKIIHVTDLLARFDIRDSIRRNKITGRINWPHVIRIKITDNWESSKILIDTLTCYWLGCQLSFLALLAKTSSWNKLLYHLEISLFFSLKSPSKPSLILARRVKSIDTNEILCQLRAKNVKNKKRSTKSVRCKSKIKILVFQKMLKVRLCSKDAFLVIDRHSSFFYYYLKSLKYMSFIIKFLFGKRVIPFYLTT